MNDLVERLLRSLAEQQAMPDDWWKAEWEKIKAEQAAEITRLRALNAELVEALEYVWDKVLTEYYDEENPIREKAYHALLRAKGEA